MISREIAARDRFETLRREFQAPPGAVRAAVGRRLVRLGKLLEGAQPSQAHLEARHRAAVAR